MTAAEKFATMGEALARRKLEKHVVAGVDHFVPGQYGVFVENNVAYVTFVDQMGHFVNVPFGKHPDDCWVAVGVYQRAGQMTAEPIQTLPDDYEPSAEVMEALDGLA